MDIESHSNKTLTYICLLCGRDKFTSKQPHNCVGGYRKRGLKWKINNMAAIESDKKQTFDINFQQEIEWENVFRIVKLETRSNAQTDDIVKALRKAYPDLFKPKIKILS